MANWVHVENNKITGQYDILPKNWRNVSGLDLSKDNVSFLKSLGWYPVTKQVDSYDDVNYYISGYDYEIRENDVLEKYVLSEKPENAPIDLVALKTEFLNNLREVRDQKLSDSDWTQLVDVQNLFDEETKNKWMIYRQELRDITEIYLNNDIIDINQVNWPTIEN
jgi:hypothetical protein